MAAAAVAGSISYGAVSMVTRSSDSSTPSALAAPARVDDGRASRSGGNCGRTGPGQARVEQYLSGQTARYGQITMDAAQDATDCAAIKKFQTAVGLPTVTGYADETTAQIADRLFRSKTGDCQAAVDATTMCVDLSHQTLWVMKDGAVIFAPAVVRTGGEEAPVGDFTITEKKQTTVFFGGERTSVNLLGPDAQAVYDLTEVGNDVHVFDAN